MPADKTAKTDNKAGSESRSRAQKQYSQPSMVREIRLNTSRIQHLYRRQYRITNNSLHYLTSDLASIMAAQNRYTPKQQQDLVNAVADTLSGIFDETRTQLASELERLTARCEEHGIAGPEYDRPLYTEAPVSSPSAGQFIEILLTIDDIVAHNDALWISGILKDPVHATTTRHWYKAGYALTNRIIDLAHRARRSNRTGVLELFPAEETSPPLDMENPEHADVKAFVLDDEETAALGVPAELSEKQPEPAAAAG